MRSDPLLTEKKLDELKKKLKTLKAAHPEAAAEVSRLSELGDFSENTEYQMAKARLRSILFGIQKLEHQINNAIIIPSHAPSDIVEVGTAVTISDGATRRSFHILGSSEANPQHNIISHTSPLGSALLGHKVGDKIIVNLSHKVVEYRILKIE